MVNLYYYCFLNDKFIYTTGIFTQFFNLKNFTTGKRFKFFCHWCTRILSLMTLGIRKIFGQPSSSDLSSQSAKSHFIIHVQKLDSKNIPSPSQCQPQGMHCRSSAHFHSPEPQTIFGWGFGKAMAVTVKKRQRRARIVSFMIGRENWRWMLIPGSRMGLFIRFDKTWSHPRVDGRSKLKTLLPLFFQVMLFY